MKQKREKSGHKTHVEIVSIDNPKAKDAKRMLLAYEQCETK